MAQPLGASQGESDGFGSVSGLLLRFTAAGVATMVLLAIGIAVVARMQAMQKGIDEARNTTWVVGHAVQPMLVRAAHRGRRRARRAGRVGASIRARRVVGAGEGVGRGRPDSLLRCRCPHRPAVRPRHGGPPRPRASNNVAGVSELDDPENTLEADFGTLLEVYLGCAQRPGNRCCSRRTSAMTMW